MGNKKIRKIVKDGVLLSLIPAICTYLGQDNNILVRLQEKGYIGPNVNLELFRDWMNILSIVLTFTILTVPLIIANMKSESYKAQRDTLLKNNKDIFGITLKEQLKLENCHINIRVFVPKITLRHIISKWLHLPIKLEYHIKNIDGLADHDITENLKFEVYPRKQGLVGNCYSQKAVLYDDDLINSNETNYNLTDYQKAKTNRLQFILVCPIISELNEVVSIVSFDSYDVIKIHEEQKEPLRKLILNYTQSLYESIPDLFKAKGGIL